MTQEDGDSRKTGVKSIRALARGLTVLRLLQQSGGMSLNDLYRASGLPKATLLRILLTLEEEGLIWQRIADNAYLASHLVHRSFSGTEDERLFAELASPLLERLTRRVRWLWRSRSSTASRSDSGQKAR